LAGDLRQRPVNLLDPDTVEQLGALIKRIEKDTDLTVVVFRSEKPGNFMAHWDFLSDTGRVLGMSPGPTGLHPYLDNFLRLSKSRIDRRRLMQSHRRRRAVPAMPSVVAVASGLPGSPGVSVDGVRCATWLNWLPTRLGFAMRRGADPPLAPAKPG
jgi:hypothetical protein